MEIFKYTMDNDVVGIIILTKEGEEKYIPICDWNKHNRGNNGHYIQLFNANLKAMIKYCKEDTINERNIFCFISFNGAKQAFCAIPGNVTKTNSEVRCYYSKENYANI